MADAFVGEVRAFPYTFAPRGWLACNGALLPIQQYTALYSLLGAFYGGNGTTNFALPDYRGRLPVSNGTVQGGSTTWQNGTVAGTNSVTLTLQQLAAHNHGLVATTASATTNVATGNQLASGQEGGRGSSTTANIYSTAGPNVQLNNASVQPVGGSGPHNNMMPYLGLNMCICIQGLYPSRP